MFQSVTEKNKILLLLSFNEVSSLRKLQ